MASRLEKAFFVSVIHEMESVVKVQWWFQQRYRRISPTKLQICALYGHFVNNGCVCEGKSNSRLSVSTESVETIPQAFVLRP
jgi:hypothetical protein